MLFNSQIFLLLFLPVCLVAFYIVVHDRNLRVWTLIVFSLIFYGYWEFRLLPLLIISVCVNWLFAWVFVNHFFSRLGALLPLCVALNLIVLGVFKYADFFTSSMGLLFGASTEPWNILLPLGISFFTFQQISYIVDLNNGNAKLYRFSDYFLYVAFFPQLIAGPIVRHNEIIFQYNLNPLRDGLYERCSRGLVLLVIGLIKKLFIADQLVKVADPLFELASRGEVLSFGQAWLATGSFTMQIYFDFSAYSDMAIGLALLFGFSLPINFNIPYIASSIREFWKRWHITLSTFLRDYLYIPLGGSHHGIARTVTALLLTMLLGGLWHGAAWTFVVWGGLHGLALAINHIWSLRGFSLPNILGWMLTIVFVVFTWVLFRATDFHSAWSIWQSLIGMHGFNIAVELSGAAKDWWWIFIPASFVALYGPPSQQIALELLVPRRKFAVLTGVLFAFCIAAAGGWVTQEFIYFQF